MVEDTAKKLSQQQGEVNAHFKMRVTVYERAIEDGQDDDRAQQMAIVFRNCYFLGCQYSSEVVTESQKYWEKEWITRYSDLIQT